MSLATLIDRMIALGVPPGAAGSIAAEIYATGVASVTVKPKAGALRMTEYRDRREAMGMPRVFPADHYRPLLVARDGDRCIYCEACDQLVIDHIHPTFLGGDDDMGNLGLACRPCNGRKAGKPLQAAGMHIVVGTAARAHEGYISRTVCAPQDGEQLAPETRTTAHNGAHVRSDPNPPISNSKNLKVRERQNRGTRITPEWSPSDAERAFAKQEGFSDWEIQRETQKFRDYWTACAGAKGVKLDWSATWRQWIRNGADRAGKTPAPSGQGAAAGLLYYAKPESEQLAAWDAWAIKANGKSLPRDKNGGWNVKAEWPPEYVRPEKLREMSATPLFRSMS